MAVSPTTCFGPRAETSILETNQYLRSELEKCKQNFRDLTEKFLTSKATAYSLANHLRKYNCEECKDLIKSVLEEELQFQERELAELPRPAARLRIHDPLIQAQAKELTHLRQKIQEGRGVCYLFTQHVKNTVKSFEGLLRNTGIAYYQRQRFCEQMVQGSQLTEVLVRKLATENHNGKKNEDRQKLLAPRLRREAQEEEMDEVLEDSLDEQYFTHSSRHDSHQLPSTNAFLSDAQEDSSALDIAKDEIQNQRQHLKETLFINNCLREKLERYLSSFDEENGCTSNLYRQIIDSVVQLYNENRVLREEYRQLPRLA